MLPTMLHWEGHYEMMADICLSICWFVSRVPQPNLTTERPRKPKIGTTKADHTGNPRTYLEVQRSKINVTRLINAVRDNAAYGD